MKTVLLCTGLLVLACSSARAQIDLTWDNCVLADVGSGEPAASNGKVFDCTALNTYRLHGTFKTPVDIPDFFAMDMSIDLQQSAPGALVPFYHYDRGGFPIQLTGCNASGIVFSVDKSTTGAPGDGNACALFETPWGVMGEKAQFASITAYASDFGQPGRGRLLASIAREPDSTYALVANRNYYAFHFTLSTVNRNACPTCGTPAAIVWNSANLYGYPNSELVTLSGPSAKSAVYCAWIGDAMGTCAATPTRNVTWGRLKTMYR